MVIDGFEQLPAKVALPFARLLDRREQRGLASVIMINQPPQQLKWPDRLIHRLSGSMVVEIPWLTSGSRETAFDAFLTRHRVGISRQVKKSMTAFLGPTIGCIEKQAKTVAEGHAQRLPAEDLVMLCQKASIRVSLDQIIQMVTNTLGLDRKAVLGPGREPTLVRGRQLIVVLAREHTELSLAKLGKALGGRDPATLRHALTAFRTSMDDGLKRQTAVMSRQLEAYRWGTRC
jgi:chromosomal replication initiator protein